MSALGEVVQGNGLLADVEELVKVGLWAWIEGHLDDKVFTIRIWFISKTFYVRDLTDFATLLLGPPPTPSAQ